MSLTTAQLQVLKADIAADPTLNAVPNTPDGNASIAAAYNAPASPTFIVWKTAVTITVIGDNINATELAGLTATNLQRLSTIAQYSELGVNPSLADRRAFFDDVFSGAGGQLTRPKLLALWKRASNRVEKLYATGIGSDAAPAALVFEGTISNADVLNARNMP